MQRLWARAPLRARDARKEFADLVALCGLPLRSYTLQVDATGTRVTYTPTDAAEAERTEQRLDRAYQLVARDEEKEVRVLFDNLGSGNGRPDSPPITGYVALAPGLFAGSQAAATLRRRLDNLLLEIAVGQGATEICVPHLIPWVSLHRAHYNAAHPEHLTTCQAVRRDLDAIEALAAADSIEDVSEAMAPEPVCLTPAACYHLYPLLSETDVGPGKLLTAVASCTRRESVWTPRPIRLWAFQMRELVTVAPAADVLAFRDRHLEVLAELGRRLGLPCQVTTATDPFFTSRRRGQRGVQQMLDLKHELVARDAEGNDFAVASVNLHRDAFGRAFRITAGGEPAHSACFATGLDRCAYWILSHCGQSAENWPEPLRTGNLAAASATAADTVLGHGAGL